MFELRREKSHYVFGKRLRYNDCRIVFARFHSLESFVFIGKFPVKTAGLAYLRNQFVAGIDAHRQKFGFIAFVAVGNRNFQIRDVSVRVVAAGNIEPGIERRNNNKTRSDNQRDRIARDMPKINNGNGFYIPYFLRKTVLFAAFHAFFASFRSILFSLPPNSNFAG